MKIFESKTEKKERIFNNYRNFWISYADSKLSEGQFHIPLEPKPLSDLSEIELFLLDSSEFELVTSEEDGISFFKCKLKIRN